jgi:hypothetical protein
VRTDIVGWVRLQWDRAGAWACLLAGVVTLFVGWLGVSETAYTAKQLPYIAGCGLGGMFLLGTAAMLRLTADLRDEWRKLDRIEKAIIEHGPAGIDTSVPERSRTGPGGHRAAEVTPSSDIDSPLTRVAAGRSS